MAEPDLTAELDAAEDTVTGNNDDRPAAEHDDSPPPPGTGDVVVTSPSLGAPWDYGPGIDLQGAQFHPRWRWPAKRRYDR